jgi:hypothetical protein
LEEGVTYKLIVCFDHCPNYTCDCSNCWASGSVYN